MRLLLVVAIVLHPESAWVYFPGFEEVGLLTWTPPHAVVNWELIFALSS